MYGMQRTLFFTRITRNLDLRHILVVSVQFIHNVILLVNDAYEQCLICLISSLFNQMTSLSFACYDFK